MSDFAVIWDWLAFAIRWTHVVTAICWIGSSFYFVALDLGLRKVPGTERNGRSMAAASTTSRNTWSRPSGCPST